MYLLTGKRVYTYYWEYFIIYDEVIIRVEDLSEKDKQPTLVDSMPIFERRLGNLIDVEEDNMGEIIQNVEYAHTTLIEE